MIVNFGSYRAKIKPGNVPSAIVSLAGVGHPAADNGSLIAMSFEWEHTLQRLERREHVIFLQDTGRSWFNDAPGWDELVSFLNNYFASNRITHKVALGLSMGATGSIILGSHIRFDKVIGMSPQALIPCDDCPWDDRFTEFRKRIRMIRFTDTSRIIEDGDRYQFIFSFDDPIDMRHASVFHRTASKLDLAMVRGAHNIGSEMARRRSLDRFVYDLLQNEHGHLTELGVFKADRQLFDLVDDEPDRTRILELGLTRPGDLPSYFYPIYHEEVLNLNLERGEAYQQAVCGNPFPIHAAQIIEGQSLVPYAVYGWSSEDNWSVGRHHILTMRVMDILSFPDAWMELTLEPLLHERHRRQRVQVMANGMPMVDAVAEYGAHGQPYLSVVIQPLASIVEIHVTTFDSISPSRLGMNEDIRPLAVRLVKIQLFPFDSRPAPNLI
jgi:hypothetical protein